MSTKTQIKSKSRKERRLRAAKNKVLNRKQVREFRPKKGTVAKQAPLAEGYIRKYEKAKTVMTKTGIVVAHREYVGSVTSSNDLSFAQLRINPADPVTFPWLSTIAGAYEKFKIKKMKICYQKNCASITPGYVYMYPDYNVERTAMTTEALFLNTMDVVETSPWVSTDLTIKPAKLNQLKTYLIRSPYETYSGKDYLLYDPLNIFIGTAQSLANDPINVGRIFIDYEIELTIPDPETNLRLYSLDVHYTGLTTSLANGGGYVPDLTAPATTYYRGNYPISTQQQGFTFSDNFCGLCQIYFVGSGFDASRIPDFVPTNGVAQLDGTVLSDITLGVDIWSFSYWLNMKKDSTFLYSSTASLTTSSTTGCYIIFELGSANPRWFSSPDPKITGAFGTHLSALNAKPVSFLPLTVQKAVKSMKKSTKLSSKKKMFEVEDSD